MDALLDNKKLTCRGCHNYLEPPLQVCSNDYAHLFCGKCKGKYDECVICNGKISDLSPRIQETFFAQKYPCKYHLRGCNAMSVIQEKGKHENECNFKIFKCEFGRFCSKPPCDWEGPYSEIQHHFRSTHVKYPFSKNPPLSIKMRIPGGSFSFIQMIQAYNELFWFKYRIDSEKQKVFFVLQLVGNKELASEFSFELEIISLINANSAIHFTEKCYSDSEDISNIFESEQCAVTSFSKIKNFLVDNKLTFNYSIKKIKKFVKNPNLSPNTEDVQKQNSSKTNHNPRHNQRRRRGQKGNSKSRDHSTGSNVSKKGQNNEFEILDFKDFDKQLPSSNNTQNKNRSNNFDSVFSDKSSQQSKNMPPPAYQAIDPVGGRTTYQPPYPCQQNFNQVNPGRNSTNNIQPPNYNQNTMSSINKNTAQSNYGNPNPVKNTSYNVLPPVQEYRTVTPTVNNQASSSQASSTSARQTNYYNANQSAQFRAPKERKQKKEDNCIIS